MSDAIFFYQTLFLSSSWPSIPVCAVQLSVHVVVFSSSGLFASLRSHCQIYNDRCKSHITLCCNESALAGDVLKILRTKCWCWAPRAARSGPTPLPRRDSADGTPSQRRLGKSRRYDSCPSCSHLQLVPLSFAHRPLFVTCYRIRIEKLLRLLESRRHNVKVLLLRRCST